MQNNKDFHYYFKFNKENNFEDLWRMKDSVRLALRAWMITFHYAQESANIIANACSELIENSIKYSEEKTTSQVKIYAIQDSIYIETLNTATPERIIKIRQTLAALEDRRNHLTDLYLEKIRSAPEGQSELGLIKIIMETKGELSLLSCTEADLLHIQLKVLDPQRID